MAGLAFDQHIDTIEGRWSTLRNMVKIWGGSSLEPSAKSSLRISAAQVIAQSSLPHSLVEAIKFCSELQDVGWAYDFEFEKVPEFDGLILGTYCDDNWYVAIRDEDLIREDPPIQFLMREDYESGPLKHDSSMASFLSCHKLIGLLGPLSGAAKGGDFQVEVEPTSGWLDEMRSEFQVSVMFAEYHIFESAGRLIVVGPDYHVPDQNAFSMHGIWSSKRDGVPECVQRHLKNGGAFSGRFETLW